MILETFSPPSVEQDKQNKPPKFIFKEMELVGYLLTSEHEIKYQESNDYYYYYSIDRKQMIAFDSTQPIVSCHVQLHKKLTTHYHPDELLSSVPQIGWVYTSLTYKHQNVAVDMYSFLLRRHGMLWSDSKHSVGACKLWERMAQKYKVSLIDFENQQDDSGYPTMIKEWTKSSLEDKWYANRNYLLLAHHSQ